MSDSFGTKFVLISDVVQVVPGLAMGVPPQKVVHHATIKRGFKEYVVLATEDSQTLFLNEVERNRATFNLLKIKDDVEFSDLVDFLTSAGIFHMGGLKKYAN